MKPIGQINDLEIVLVPIDEPRPGFDVKYKLIYKNIGNTVLSGNLVLVFEDNYMDLISSIPTHQSVLGDSINWSFQNLHPFHSNEIIVTFNLNMPTDTNYPLNSGDVLNFGSNINSDEIDHDEQNNSFNLSQIVINSFDPNDKICLEGESISIEQVGEYVHYKIRFENTGTANAQNIVVKDFIDLTKFEIETLIPVTSSHDFKTYIRNQNEINFLFENINLPFDDANNDGYVVFKIKTKSTLAINETFSNQAEIYFDYNAPIITNDFETIVLENMGTSENELFPEVKIYPNPAKDHFRLDSNETIQYVEIFDQYGRIIKKYSGLTEYSISELPSGIYHVKIYTKKFSSFKKLIKK